MKNEKDMIILAIETSCDETSAAVVKNGKEILSNAISSQIELHAKFGGVVPEVASRKHVEKMNPIIDEALNAAGITFADLDAVAVTHGPGLIGALLVGLAEAKAIAFALDIPLIGVHHIEGHISANYIEHNLKPPFLCMVVSGGHTHLVEVKDYGSYNIIGRTRDDAVGEAYDKVARSIGLGYPGGPKMDVLAKMGNGKAIDFPRTYLEKGSYDFSFSGIKSAVLNYLNQMKMKDETINPSDVAASFQEAVIEVITNKTMMAAKNLDINKIALAGGVASNSRLREEMHRKAKENGYDLYYPSPIYCTDNAAMIGIAAYYDYQNGIQHDMSLNASSNIQFGKV
ncbi:MAG: tRNA (adenosine(37)-N6)-threonylcarbamoyltransferase complex transferase subunit TsaD [Vallitaleaceae bacterium]|nr:tRNA (adenosine(37)-N6)-threonylcarbamoyltransferase complex transferase subunit TsaD [Vallitaleaceae bacterium]